MLLAVPRVVGRGDPTDPEDGPRTRTGRRARPEGRRNKGAGGGAGDRERGREQIGRATAAARVV